MTTGIILLNFGEPPEPEREVVVEYLTNIFFNNADLEGATTEEEAMARSRELARRRAPGLIEEYEAIGGSPLNAQSDAQAALLEAALADRGIDVETYVGHQFLEPYVADAVEEARDDGVEHLIGLPIYPLCGPSTTVAALDELEEAVATHEEWDVRVSPISGWHKHPLYTRLRADAIRAHADERGVDLADEETTLVFSAHGTPTHYLEEGSRYVIYVEEFCETIAALVGVETYELGYQNHSNRNIEWTQPDVEDVIETVDADRVVVDPVSFMHEQSETLSELDVDLREDAEAVGLEFHRVPVPHDDPRFGEVLADLVEPFVAGFEPGYYQFRQCQCRDVEGTMCLNAPQQPAPATDE
ncbi:ferrochelatase [Natronobeatus ordinarius]|uniref:ferrochelatase n=1 Tax=Natronobeatus ordinarius TaxID=2963433 RepID=UPI0020CC2CE6|nr:ferrochelatase [Natronobeatus ordinarius]